MLARLESLSESLLHDASDAEGEIDKKAEQIFDIVTFEESTDTTRIQNKLGAILIYLCEKYLANTPRERDIRQVTLSKVNEIARQQTIDKIKHSFLDALQSLHRYYANSLTHSEAQLIMQFENIVASRYAEPLTLKDIAAELNVSYSFLPTLINKTLKMRFSQYLIEARLKASLQLLSNTDLPLAEIAHNVGFSDQSHFSKSFRKMYDQPPQQYRKSGMRG